MNQDSLKRSTKPQTEEQEIDNILSSIRELIADEVRNDPTVSHGNSNNIQGKNQGGKNNNEKKVLELTNSIDDIGFNSNMNNKNLSIEDIDMVNFEDTATAKEMEMEATEQTTTVEIEGEAPSDSPAPEGETAVEEKAGAAAEATGADAGTGTAEGDVAPEKGAQDVSPEIDESMLEKIDTLEVGDADIDVEGLNENENNQDVDEAGLEGSAEGAELTDTAPEIDEAEIAMNGGDIDAEMGAGDFDVEVVGDVGAIDTGEPEQLGVEVADAGLGAVASGLREGIVSEETIAKAAEALNVLENLTERSAKAIELDRKIGQKTVDELMQEILRPLLKEWLDANLPSLVKWVVTEQVEKLIREKTKDN